MEPIYCAAPWRGLHINPRGDVKTCCAGDPNMLGNLNDNSIQQILHGPKMQEIRKTVQQGKLHPEYCYNCIKAETYGRSERHWHNDVNKEFDPTAADLSDHRPVLIDVRWNITCNLSCNYCGPKCSSKWAAKTNEYFDNGVRPYFQQVCEYIDQHRDSVKEVALVGGEPLLLPENDQLLDIIPEDAIITLITNMSVDFERNSIVRKLAKRTRVGWSMSFENIGPRFEYVRHGGNWWLLKHNVNMVAGLMKNQGHWGGIHAVYNLYSATRLCELREYANSENITILWQTLYQPECLDPVLHGPEIRKLCISEIDRYRQAYKLTAQEDEFFSAARTRLASAESPGTVKERMSQHLRDIETKYHKHFFGQFRSLWPELSEFF